VQIFRFLTARWNKREGRVFLPIEPVLPFDERDAAVAPANWFVGLPAQFIIVADNQFAARKGEEHHDYFKAIERVGNHRLSPRHSGGHACESRRHGAEAGAKALVIHACN
jgi:hypothetical protein